MMIEASTPTIFKNSLFSIEENYDTEDFISDTELPPEYAHK
jgi:hypothetical protein